MKDRMGTSVVTKKMFAWNLAGCTVNALLSFFMLAFASWNVGLEQTGYFSMALAVSQQLLAFGKYGVRTYQATDVKKQLQAGSYFCHRLVTVSGMVLAAFVFVCISGYPPYKKSIVLSVCALKAVDAVEDVFHGELQRNGNLDTAGKLLTLRSLLTLAIFGIVIFCSRDLLPACRAAWMISLAFCLAANLMAVKRPAGSSIHADRCETMKLFRLCFPLSASQFLSLSIYNMPKYAIDAVMASEIQAVYSMIFMPTFIINLISEFAFKPLLTPLSILWEKEDKNAACRIILKLYLVAAGTALVILAGGFLFGIPLLEWFYQTRLQACKREFMVLLLGGGFSAAVYLSCHLLTMMRKLKDIFRGYLLGMGIMTVAVWKMVQEMGMFGAACSYLFAEMLILLYFCRSMKGCMKGRIDAGRD